MSDPDNAQLRSFVERILRCREAEDEAKADTKDVYAEAKSMGFDKTALGAVVSDLRAREKNGAKVEEREALIALYWNAYHGRADDPRVGTEPATHRHEAVQ